MEINEIIIGPVMTEKATNLSHKNIFTFKVNKKANKNQIKNAIETLYQVKIAKISTEIIKGKRKKTGKRRIEKKLSEYKIAYVKLSKGNLPFYPKA